MFRKWLFLGLMIMLGGVLLMLIFQARREQARVAAAPAEIVKTARSTATRMMAPDDIDVTQSLAVIAQPEAGSAKAGTRIARCRLVIRNRGQESYHDMMLQLLCLGSSGKALGTLKQPVPETLQPGQVLTIEDVSVTGIPPGTRECRFSILYASLGPAPAR